MYSKDHPAGRALSSGQVMPVEIEAMIVRDMEDLGVERALIYAFQHTGLLVTDDTMNEYTAAELARWQEAVDKYRRIEASAA